MSCAYNGLPLQVAYRFCEISQYTVSCDLNEAAWRLPVSTSRFAGESRYSQDVPLSVCSTNSERCQAVHVLTTVPVRAMHKFSQCIQTTIPCMARVEAVDAIKLSVCQTKQYFASVLFALLQLSRSNKAHRIEALAFGVNSEGNMAMYGITGHPPHRCVCVARGNLDREAPDLLTVDAAVNGWEVDH